VSVPAIILLHPDDNVVVCARPVKQGELLGIPGMDFASAQDLGTGHKIACRDVQPGGKVLKYGMPIGSFTRAVRAGDWVHFHNMKSDYMSPHTRAGLAVEAP
jgi:D-threo-aldose 1-dehydrogenase